jgi:hypothetical protein
LSKQFSESRLLEVMVRSKHLLNLFLLEEDYAYAIGQAPFFIETAPVKFPTFRQQHCVGGDDSKI